MRIKYHNLYIHFILSTKNRIPLIPESSRKRVEKYITGIVKNLDSKLYAIYANPDHVHMLVSRSPGISEEGMATIIADGTRKFIFENKLSNGIFLWQETAAAFSVSKSDVERVCRYILNQGAHHRKVSFAEEYEKLMKHYQRTIQPGRIKKR